MQTSFKTYAVSLFAIALFLLSSTSPALAQALRLPAVIGDHMVLQREMPVPIWGWAEPGAEVTLAFKGQGHDTKADADGKWRIDLEPLEASAEPAEMRIHSGDTTLTVSDILVGEVWLCSGQSNMEWTVQRSANPEEEIKNGNWPQIRHIKAPRKLAMTPQDDIDASWQVASPETVAEFTAVGYYFARRLHQELGVPIGLLNCSWGGTRIEPWTPIEGFAAVEEVESIYNDVLRRLPNPPAGLEPAPAYTDRQNPTVLFNAMMAPVVPFAIRGSLWYQGESNRADGMAYFHKTRALVAGWREVWDKPELPFYFVHIAPFQYGEDDPLRLPELWDAQSRAAAEIEHADMVVISDIGNINDIHPKNKQGVGLRLANLALKNDYGYDDLLVTGPVFNGMELSGSKLTLTFDYVGDGLASRDGEPLNHFEIAGPGQGWTPATAVITGPNTIDLSAPGVTKPTAVRFAWHKTATPNLMNSAGLPAAPFRAGEVPDQSGMLNNVPEAEQFKLVYALDLGRLGPQINYDQDHSDQITQDFDRVAYYLELGDTEGQTQWVFVSMDAFTDDPTKLGIPTTQSGASFQRAVRNLSVRSNVEGLPNADRLSGNIEFWPNNYTKPNSAGVPGASDDFYDHGDTPNDAAPDGYGSMQVHLRRPQTTVFAINHWSDGSNADLGIGTNASGQPDYTFSKTASRWQHKQLRVLVR